MVCFPRGVTEMHRAGRQSSGRPEPPQVIRLVKVADATIPHRGGIGTRPPARFPEPYGRPSMAGAACLPACLSHSPGHG